MANHSALSSSFVGFPSVCCPVRKDTAYQRPWVSMTDFDNVAGDIFNMFQSADAHFIKHRLHEWKYYECTTILTKTRNASDSGTRPSICEYVVADPNIPQPHMACWGSSRERTTEEYSKLLRSRQSGSISSLRAVLFIVDGIRWNALTSLLTNCEGWRLNSREIYLQGWSHVSKGLCGSNHE